MTTDPPTAYSADADATFAGWDANALPTAPPSAEEINWGKVLACAIALLWTDDPKTNMQMVEEVVEDAVPKIRAAKCAVLTAEINELRADRERMNHVENLRFKDVREIARPFWNKKLTVREAIDAILAAGETRDK